MWLPGNIKRARRYFVLMSEMSVFVIRRSNEIENFANS